MPVLHIQWSHSPLEASELATPEDPILGFGIQKYYQ